MRIYVRWKMNKLHLVSTKKPNKEIRNLYIEAFPAMEL